MNFDKFSVLLVAGILAGNVASADDTPDGWYGEGSFSAGYTTGNTETSDLGLGVNLNRKAGVWTYSADAIVDYGEQDGIETRNRAYLAGEIDREINDRLFGFGRASYEVDQFTGFDSRTFVGGGIGYTVVDGDQTKWTVRGGPGVKIDEVKRVVTTDDTGAALIIPAESRTSFGAVGRSEFTYDFNDHVALSNHTDIVYGEESTQIANIVALTSNIVGNLSARVSFDVRYDTNPPLGFEDTDTATKLSVIYKFGE